MNILNNISKNIKLNNINSSKYEQKKDDVFVKQANIIPVCNIGQQCLNDIIVY